VWRVRIERFRCGWAGHAWIQRMYFGPGELRNFAVCTRCGALDEEQLANNPGTGFLRRRHHND